VALSQIAICPVVLPGGSACRKSLRKELKIKVIIPNSSVPFLYSQIENRKEVAPPGCVIDVVCLPHGPIPIESAHDEAMAAPYIVEQVKKAENDGFDAVSLDCAMDTVVRASREAVKIPVASAGEASYLIAMGLCRKFAVVTVLKSTATAIEENIGTCGFSERCVSVRYARIPVLGLQDGEKAFRAILEEAKAAIVHDGAECIVLGCTGMSSLSKRLMDELGVPVVDPAVASLRMAELCVRMGLTMSKIAYETPSDKEIL
jgi:allantoin racemase